MSPNLIYALTGTLAVLLGGIIVLVPLLALTIRYALRPVLETWSEVRQNQIPERHSELLERRLALLESEVQHISQRCESLVEAQEFQRQLSQPAAARQDGQLLVR
jgi:hypothetical protein